ncbi:MAG TPA: IPT/TIG domain-containing protein [Blastocatellia bacterium]|nr:IPT/TIG domain-containing protein [Blastocatellia bacterium]
MSISVAVNVQNANLPVTIGVPFPQSAGLLSTAALRVKNPSGAVIAGSSAFEVLSRWGGEKTDATKPIMIALVSFKPSATGSHTIDDSNAAYSGLPIQITDGANDIRVQNGALDVRVTKNSADLLSQFIIGSTEQLAAASKPRLVTVATADTIKVTGRYEAGSTNQIAVTSTVGLAVGQQIRLKWEGGYWYTSGGAVVAKGEYSYYNQSESVKRQIWINRGQANAESLTLDFIYVNTGSARSELYYQTAPVRSHVEDELVEDKTLLDDYLANGAYTIQAINQATNTLTLSRSVGVKILENTMIEVIGGGGGAVTAPFQPSSTIIERQTEQYAIIRQRGKFTSNVSQSVEVTVRWHFWKDQPWVKAQVKLNNYSSNRSVPAVDAAFTDLRFEIPTANAASGSDQVLDNATAVSRVNAGTTTVTLSAGSFQLAVPEFAEKWPKGLSGDANGFHFSIFPTAAPAQTLPADRATSVEFFLGNAVAAPATLTSRPTNCALDPAYVVSTQAHRAVTTVAQTWTAAQFGGDAEMAEAANRAESSMAVAYDVTKAVSYGSQPAASAKEFRTRGEYGDGFGWSVFGTFPWQDNPRCYNHYDTQYHVLVQYLRSGDLRALQLGSECARYVADYGVYQSRALDNPGFPYFERQGLIRFEDEDRRGPAFPSHSWWEGLWLYWSLTGDPAVLESVSLSIESKDENNQTVPGTLLVFDWAPTGANPYPGAYYGNGAGWNIFSSQDGFRWVSWAAMGLLAAYRYFGRQSLLAKAQQYLSCFTACEAAQGSHGWYLDQGFEDDNAPPSDPNARRVSTFIQYGYTLIPAVEYWHLTGDATVRDYIARVGKMVAFGDAQLTAQTARKDTPLAGGVSFAGQYLATEGSYFWWPQAQTTLAAGIAAGDTTLTLTDGAKFVDWGGNLAIDDGTNIEYVQYSSRSGNTVSGLTRARYGSTARAWSAGVAVYPVPFENQGTPSVGRSMDYLPGISAAAKITGDAALGSLAKRVFKDTAFYFGQGGPLLNPANRFPLNFRTDGFPGSSVKNYGQRAFGFEQYLADVVANPVPAISSIIPATKTAGDPAFTLTVNGTDFINGSVVRINGQDRTTTFVSATQVTAQIPSSDVAAAGTLQVTVFNPGPGGGLSNSLPLTVNPSGAPPATPDITGLDPLFVWAGGPQFVLTINGSDFQNGAIVQVGGSNRSTTFVNATQVTVQIPASDIAAPAVLQIRITNPDGGASLDHPLMVVARAELPREWIYTGAVPATTGSVITVNAGDDLQAAINAAQPGDRIEVMTGAYTGNFTLPNKAGNGWIVITTANPAGSLPPKGTRVTPGTAANYARLVSPNNQPALSTAPSAHYYWLAGLEITADAAVAASDNLVSFGDASSAQNSLALVPHHLVLDRCWIHGQPNKDSVRGVALNCAYGAVVECYISEIHKVGQEAQAINGLNGPGPFKIVNNYLEGAGENVMFGGGDPHISGLIPSDIEFRQNYCRKPLSWNPNHASYAGTHWAVKNIFELKNAQRVLVDGNIFEYCWIDGQDGTAILFTVRNQDGTAPWSTVQDVTFTNNLITGVAQGFNLLGEDNNQQSIRAARFLIEHNLLDLGGGGSNPVPDQASFGAGTTGRAFKLTDVQDFVFRHNTVFAWNSWFTCYTNTFTPSNVRCVIVDNALDGTQFGIIGDGTGSGNPTIQTYLPDAVFARNIFVAVSQASYPAGNHYPAAEADVKWKFTTAPATPYYDNVTLDPTSPYAGLALDGADPGFAKASWDAGQAGTFDYPAQTPAISSLAPDSAAAGGAQFTLIVNGTNFAADAVVRWNGSSLATSFISAEQLAATVPAQNLASAGTAQITVHNAADNTTSGPATFTITSGQGNPVPSISSLSPSAVVAGSGQFTLAVSGGNFVNGSVVRVGGSDRATTFTSATQLTAVIPASDITAAGTLQVTVFNPGPGGGLSNAATLTVTWPAPSVSGISPSSVTAGGAQFVLTVNGAGFRSGATVKVGGSARSTTFVSAMQLTAVIPASDIASAGALQITVTNSDNQTSNAVTLTVTAAPGGGMVAPSPRLQPAKRTLILREGDTFEAVRIFRVGDALLDLTGCTAELTVWRTAESSAAVLLTLSSQTGGLVTDTANARITITLTAAQVSALTWKTAVYKLRLTTPGGQVITLLQGDIRKRW